MTRKPSRDEPEQRSEMPGAMNSEQSVQNDELLTLFNLSLDMLCVADFSGHFQIVNTAFETILGHSRSTLLNTPFIEFVHPDDVTSTLQAVAQLTSGKSVSYFENRYRCKDGTYKWLAWTTVPMIDRGTLYAVARDITRHKSLQMELESQRDLFNHVLSNVPVSIFWKDRNSVFLGANKHFARDAGAQSPDEIIGRTDYDLAWTKEEADFYRECDKQVMESCKPMLDIEETQQQADGKEVTLLTNKVPLQDSSGTVYGLLGVYMNISRRKQAENALAVSEQLFRTIFNSSNQFIGILDPEGVLLNANQTALDAVGLKKEDVIGRPFWDIYCWSYSADVQNRLKKAIRDASQGILVHYVENLKFKDDEIRTIDNTFRPVSNQQGETVLIIPEGWDITE
ncbi:MAG TPA: PAS domain S-box protein, partial [Gammaproteobacteria bacterium]|nr:PAS domain S-box protein [Gammaproteobacteria bacterium]